MTRIHEHPEDDSVETVETIMRPATFASESKPVDDLLREMQARHVHVAIVFDGYGGTVSMPKPWRRWAACEQISSARCRSPGRSPPFRSCG